MCHKIFALVFLWVALPLLAASQSAVFSASELKFHTFGNASANCVPGKPFSSVRCLLGGTNEIASGAVVFPIAPESIKQDFKQLSVIFKGSGEPGEFVILLVDVNGKTWCWNGARWQGSAAISSASDFWQKRVFSVDDFKITDPGSKEQLQDLKQIRQVQFACGIRMEQPSKRRADFLVAKIAFEKNAVAESVAGYGSDAEKKAANSHKLIQNNTPVVIGKLKNIPLSSYELPPNIHWKLPEYSKDLRNDLLLNQYWQFQPVLKSASELILKDDGQMPTMPETLPPTGTWFYAKVPGSWDNQGGMHIINDTGKAISRIDERSVSTYAQGWYRRAIAIPAEWKGQQIRIQFEAINDHARLFINGVRVAKDILKTACIDISPYLHYGQSNDISVFVQYNSFPFSRTHGKFREFREMGADWWFGWHHGPGLTGDVKLLVRPEQLHFNKMRIGCSVKEKALRIDAELSNLSLEKTLTIKAEVFDDSKSLFKFKPQTIKVGENRQIAIALSSSWTDPIYWSPENPKLYSVQLSAYDSAGKLLDRMSDRFGFRELSINAGNFYLNGVKYRLKFFSNQYAYEKMPEPCLKKFLLTLKKMNFNGIIYESLDPRTVKLADELGLMIAMRYVMPSLVRNGEYLPGVSNKGYPAEIYLSGKLKHAREEFSGILKNVIGKFRNNPSVVIWAINPLLCYNPEWINPDVLDSERAENDLAIAALRMEAEINDEDPERIVMQSMGGNTGKIITSNPYSTFSNPPDEWADWPMKWSTRKIKPLVLEEVALPFWNNFANWENSVTKAKTDFFQLRQLYYEQSARFWGDDIYPQSHVDYKDANWHLDTGLRKQHKDGNTAVMDPAALKTKCMYLESCIKAWRIYDISGIWLFDDPREFLSDPQGKIPMHYDDLSTSGPKFDFGFATFSQELNELFDTIKKVQQPFLAFVGGSPGHFTSREHLYFAGENIEKQMLFSNDSLTSIPVDAEWKLTGPKEEELSSGRWGGILQAGEVKKVPFEFNLPCPGEYDLLFQASGSGEVCYDSFKLNIFPRKVIKMGSELVRVYDETGKTTSLLQKMGITFTTDLSADTRIMVVGNNSFSEAFLKKAVEINIEKEISEHGLSLLVLSQDENSQLAPYLEERRSRYVFVKDSHHPVIKDMPKSSFSYWRGESEGLDPYPSKETSLRNSRFMRWGTRGTVAEFVMDKPDSGRFRILLDCDADLSRTPLMEYFAGKGRILFCMLNLESRYGKDPAATELAERIFTYLKTPERIQTVKTCASVSHTNAKLLNDLNFSVKKGGTPETENGLLIIDSSSSLLPGQLCSFVENGGDLLIMKGNAGQLNAFGWKTQDQKIRLAGFPRDSELLRGLGNSDFYFNPITTQSTFGNSEILKYSEFGRGRVVALSILPDDFTQNSSVVKAKRILSVILTNLGAEADDALNLSALSADPLNFTGKAVPFAVDPMNHGEAQGWHLPSFNDSQWRKIRLGCDWESQGINMENPNFSPRLATPYDGIAYYRIHAKIPRSLKGKALYFEAGPIDDLDCTWFNGVKIGETTEKEHEYWKIIRRYPIPEEYVRWDTDNVIAVKVTDLRYNGGIIGPVRITSGEENNDIPLFYKIPSRLIYQFDPNSWRQW